MRPTSTSLPSTPQASILETSTPAAATPTGAAGIAVQAPPTETATPTTPAPTATVVTEAAPTPTTAEETVTVDEPEPTEAPVEEATAPTEPVIGEFGELPPAQIVSGGLTRELSLTYELAVSPSDMPSTAPVYLLLWPQRALEDVEAIAAGAGIDGLVEDLGGGNFQAIGSTGELYVSPTVVQYVSAVEAPSGEVADDATLASIAQTWLLDIGLVSGDVDSGTVVARDDEAGRAVVLFKPVQPSPLLAVTPSATVTLGSDGTILEANVRWPESYAGSDYGLRSGDELWNEVLAGEGSIEADLSGVPGDGPVSGTVTVTAVSIAYSYAGSPAENEYLVPIVMYSGEAVLDDSGAIVPVSIYVPAVYGESAPSG
jgi:hypothetical protein